MNVKFKVEDGVSLPVYQTSMASGMDVSVQRILKYYRGGNQIPQQELDQMNILLNGGAVISISPFDRILVDTGLTLAEMDENLEIQVRSRSGLSLKEGLVVINSPGTIDADYRGKMGVILINNSIAPISIEKHQRVAQFVVSEVKRPVIQRAEEVFDTDRGEGGFGSTGTSDNI